MNAGPGCLLVLAMLAGCARQENAATGPTPGSVDPVGDVAPAIIAPGEAADPAQPPSYEVAIAAAAADHNKALERCMQQPEAVRTQCEQEANAAFAEAGTALEPLRGNQE